jgi:hypothetical protein
VAKTRAIFVTMFELDVQDAEEAFAVQLEMDATARLNATAVLEQAGVSKEDLQHTRYLGTSVHVVTDGQDAF